ncbi:hypothetical protein D3C81_1488560 [compost metagenome]
MQPHLATGIGARPHPRAAAGTHRHFGIGHRAPLRIHHAQALAHADVAAQPLRFFMPLQELQEAAEVGVVINHACGDRRLLLLTHGGRGGFRAERHALGGTDLAGKRLERRRQRARHWRRGR